MRETLVPQLACPECGGALKLQTDEQNGAEIVTGTLSCTVCLARFPVRRGVPRMRTGMDLEGLEEVAESFSYEWKAHHAGRLESDTVFGRTADEDWRLFTDGTGLSEAELAGRRVLDVGCGSGRLTRQIAEHAGTVVGTDFNEAVDELYARSGQLEHMHVVQANLFALPFPAAGFDVVWSCGVIHHTPDTHAAFTSLTRHVRPGGVLYIWVYPKRFNPFRWTKDVLEAVGLRRLSPAAILRLSKAISYPSLLLHLAYRLVRKVPPLRPRGEWAERTVKPRTLGEIQMTWNDALSPRYDFRHTEEEVIGWFRQAGFTDIVASGEPKIGVRGVAPRADAPAPQ